MIGLIVRRERIKIKDQESSSEVNKETKRGSGKRKRLLLLRFLSPKGGATHFAYTSFDLLDKNSNFVPKGSNLTSTDSRIKIIMN